MDAASVEQRLHNLEVRLRNLEHSLHPTRPSEQRSMAPRPATASTSPTAATAKVVDRFSDTGNWLGAVGVICFVFAAGFIIKLAVESGWLTPARQVGLAFLLGCSLIALGSHLFNKDQAYANFLLAGGNSFIKLLINNFHDDDFFFRFFFA